MIRAVGMAIVVEAEASDLVSLQYSAGGEGVIQWRGRECDPFCGVVGNFSSTVAGLPRSSHDENRSGEFVMGIGMTRMGWDGMGWDEMG
jgi:hypothetical protein